MSLMLDIQKYIGAPKVIVDDIDELVTKFEIRYLPRWFGHTLGNALRRIILGYDLWWAVTWMKINGVSHEYQVIDGVQESVVDMMLHIKNIRFKVDESSDTLQRVPQKFSGVGTYSADSLQLPAGVELLTPNNYLFEITDPGVTVAVDLRIEKWYGYYSLDFLRNREKENNEEDINMILVDNDFKITEYVKYDVEQVIDDFAWGIKDNLIIEIKSIHKTIATKELLTFAWEVLASYSKLLIFDDVYIDKSVLVDYSDLDSPSESSSDEVSVKTMPIDALPLSERTRNALIKNNILYVEDLEKKKKGELLLMKWVGRKAIEEINSALANIEKWLAG